MVKRFNAILLVAVMLLTLYTSTLLASKQVKRDSSSSGERMRLMRRMDKFEQKDEQTIHNFANTITNDPQGITKSWGESRPGSEEHPAEAPPKTPKTTAKKPDNSSQKGGHEPSEKPKEDPSQEQTQKPAEVSDEQPNHDQDAHLPSGNGKYHDRPECHATGPDMMPYPMWPDNATAKDKCSRCLNKCVAAGTGYDCCVNKRCLNVCEAPDRCSLCQGICMLNLANGTPNDFSYQMACQDASTQCGMC